MPSTTVRIKRETKQVLEKIADLTGRKTQQVLDEAIEAYRRHVFLEQANQAYAALQQNADQWAEELAERRAWDAATADNLKET